MCPPLEKPFRADAIRQAVMRLPFDGQTLTTLSRAPTTRIEIGEALDKNWIEPRHEPKVDLHRGTLVGMEGVCAAGIRCTACSTSPRSCPSENTEADTTALAEHQLITALRDWNELSAAGPTLRTAVNVGISVLGNLELPALVREHRPKSEKWPGLILELTEEEVVKDLDLVHEIATQLRIWGITLAIADFGEGFSSFARMRELPFSELKLDSGFVGGCAEDARNAGICQVIIDLARHFDVVSVADGLDNAADLVAIRDMGCHLGQGSVLAEPMPKAQFLSEMRKRARTGQGRSHGPRFESAQANVKLSCRNDGSLKLDRSRLLSTHTPPSAIRPASMTLGKVLTSTPRRAANAVRILSPASHSSLPALNKAQITPAITSTRRICFRSGQSCHGTRVKLVIWLMVHCQINCTNRKIAEMPC